MEPTPLILKKNEERRLRQGHAWVFSNEVDTARSPLDGFAPGQAVLIQAHDGKVLGTGYVNPHSLICARLVSRDTAHGLDRSLLVHRLNIALSLRARMFATPDYRLVHGESDGLPGLVVDRFGDILVVQLNTAGMEAVKAEVVAALEKVVKPRVILLRNDSPARDLEGLERYVETVLGTAPETVPLTENGVRFEAPLLGGQKTGWYYDHRDNRARLQRYVRGARVLDMFSYVGAWGVTAAVAGAAQVTCVDASARALDQVQRNAALNGVEARVDTIEGDAFEVLKALRADKAQFDVVVLDPPAFIKRKKDVKEGVAAYRRLNQAALQLLGKDGILVSASCSFHLQRAVFADLLYQSARHLDRHWQVLEQGHQGPDHPLHPAIPETDYIKCVVGRAVML